MVLNSITGFKVKDVTKPVVIRDSRHIIFYDTEPLLPKVEYFNLPPGIYWVDTGFFSEASFPRSYPLAKLPRPERNRPKPFDFEITFESNPNKCTILWDEKVIVFDNAFLDKPLPELFFVLYHEYGHSLYETEKYADLYASNLMKVRGYNPSQICYAHLDSLSAKQIARKEFVIDQL